MRQYIRHPSDIPIQYRFSEIVESEKEYLKNISEGGLCFSSKTAFDIGSQIHIEIPVSDPVFTANAVVVWCKEANGQYDVGVKFVDFETETTIRMVEQVCYIEKYKRDALEKEGRCLTGEEAALEWIQKYAKDFPD